MSRHNRWLSAWLVVAVCGLVALTGCKGSDEPDESVEPTGPFAELMKRVPKSDALTGWKRTGRMEVIVPGDYVPPAGAEVGPEDYTKLPESILAADAPLFEEYRHRMTVVQTLKPLEGEGQLRLAIHEMNNADEAFGLVTVWAPGAPLAAPDWTIARKAPGALVFAKDRYVVRVSAEAADPLAAAVSPATIDPAVEMAAKAAAAKIFGRGRVPEVVTRLPTENLVEETIVYFHGPVGVKAAEDKLGVPMSPILATILGNAPTVVATYREGGRDDTIFIMNRRLATDAPPIETLETFLAAASAEVRSIFTYAVADDRYTVVGTFNAEEESVQHVMNKIMDRSRF